MTCSDLCFRKVTGRRVEGGLDRLKVLGKETGQQMIAGLRIRGHGILDQANISKKREEREELKGDKQRGRTT